MDGKQLLELTRSTFNLSQDSRVSPQQLDYVISLLKPSNYLLRNHTIKGNPLTYNIHDHDITKVRQHRPFHKDIVDDLSKNVVVQKSRQMGLSEVFIGQMIYLADSRSYDRLNLLYTFPTYRQLQDFYKMRIKPEFESGYYSKIVDKVHGMSQNQIKIRDSRILFRSSSSGANMEGSDIDAVFLDEYDRFRF